MNKLEEFKRLVYELFVYKRSELEDILEFPNITMAIEYVEKCLKPKYNLTTKYWTKKGMVIIKEIK